MTTMFGHIQVVVGAVLCVFITSFWIPSASAQGVTTSEPQTEEYDTEEIITEVITEVVSTTEQQTSEEETDENDVQKPEYPGDSFVAIKFTITNREMSDNDRGRLDMEIVSEVSAICKPRFTNFMSVIVLGTKAGSVTVAEVAVLFSEILDSTEENVVLQTFYEAVELNGTIGMLTVDHLYAVDKPGAYRRIEDACDIVSCIHENMICTSVGLECISTCEDNSDYCQNNSTCDDDASGTNFITCSCIDDYKGYQCEIPAQPRRRPYSENVFIGIITAAAVILFCLLLMLVVLLCSRIRRKKSEYRSDIYPAENIIALEMSNDYFIVGGVGCQTEDSFLLTQYMRNGIPPKPGFSHSVMQTTDSFLLAKSQGRPHVKKSKTAPAPSAPTPAKSGGSNNSEKAVDVVDVPEKEQTSEKAKLAETDGGLDNEGAVNEGFVKDDDVEPTKPR